MESPKPLDMENGIAITRTEDAASSLPESISFAEEEHHSKEEEDALVLNMSTQFADWIASFLRRVILLFENLPEEGANGNAGGQTEGDAVLLLHIEVLLTPI